MSPPIQIIWHTFFGSARLSKKDLRKIPKELLAHIFERIEHLSTDPLPYDVCRNLPERNHYIGSVSGVPDYIQRWFSMVIWMRSKAPIVPIIILTGRNFHFLMAVFTFTMTSGGMGSILWAVFACSAILVISSASVGAEVLNPQFLPKHSKDGISHHCVIILCLYIFFVVLVSWIATKTIHGLIMPC